MRRKARVETTTQAALGPPATYGVAVIARVLGLTPRRVQQLAKEGIVPQSGRGRYPLVAGVQAYIKYWQDRAEGRVAIDAASEIAVAKLAKVRAETRLLEYEATLQEAQLVTTAHLEQVVGELGDKVRAALINLPANFLLDLERAGLTPEVAQPLLERIAAGLTQAIRAIADEMDDAADAMEDEGRVA